MASPEAGGSRRTDERRRGRLVEGVVSSLVQAIVAGEYAAGDLLPSEPELCERYSVSRTVVREAVKIIEDKGLVIVIQGRGSTVLASDAWNSLDAEIIAGQMDQPDNRQVFEDLTDIRIALECELAAEAAVRLTADLEERMLAAIEREGQQADDPEGFLRYDFEFHRLVTEASGNSIGRGIMASLEAPLVASRRVTSRLPGAFESAHGHHVAVLRAILDGDPERARNAMLAHLRESRRMLRDSQPRPASGPQMES